MRQRILCASPSAIAGASAIAVFVVLASLLAGSGLEIARVAILVAVEANLAWLWVVTLALNETIPPSQRPASVRFRLVVILTAAYTATFILAPNLLPDSIWAFATLHLAAMGAFLLALRFLAENLRLAEAQRRQEPLPTATPVLLSSLGGMLAVQRRVNRVFADLCDHGASSR